ncbi:MAG: TIGR02300 family protein [Terricaulis silvestris]
MAKADLGEKQVCPNCGAKFYDLRRRPATCPKCATVFDPVEEGVKVKRGRARVANYGNQVEDEEEEVEAAETEAAEEEEEEVEETAAIDADAADEPVVLEEEEEGEAKGDELPPGFSEEEAELEDDAADDDVPLLEDEEEFPEDEIGELPAEDEDEGGA